MEEIIRMLIEKDLLIVVILGIIIILLLILSVVLVIVDKGKKKGTTFDKEEKIEVLDIPSPNKEIKQEEIEEPLKVEDNKENIVAIESMLEEMQSSLEERTQKEISDFEQEQEENAIISYQELVNACRKNKEKSQEIKHEEVKEETKEEPVKKFKNSEFISPIYGKEKKQDSFEQFLNKNFDKKQDNSSKTRDNEFDLEELQREMKENEDFLEELKNFRSSL